jgi:hypothetical protein
MMKPMLLPRPMMPYQLRLMPLNSSAALSFFEVVLRTDCLTGFSLVLVLAAGAAAAAARELLLLMSCLLRLMPS